MQFFFSFLSTDFQQDCQNWNIRFHKKTWKENNLLKKLCVCYSFSEMSQKLLAHWRNFFGSVVKTALLMCPYYHYEKFFSKKVRYFLAFSHTEQTLLAFSRRFLGQGCEKTLSYFLILSGYWANNFRSFDEKGSRAVKTASHVFTGTVWK